MVKHNKNAPGVSAGGILFVVSKASGRRDDRNALALTILPLELNHTIYQCEQRVVIATTNVVAGMDPRPALAHDDVPGKHPLTTELLDTESLRVGIAAISR